MLFIFLTYAFYTAARPSFLHSIGKVGVGLMTVSSVAKAGWG